VEFFIGKYKFDSLNKLSIYLLRIRKLSAKNVLLITIEWKEIYAQNAG